MQSSVLLLTAAFLIGTPLMAASPAPLQVNPAIHPVQTQAMEISRYIFRLTSSRNMLMQMAGARSDELSGPMKDAFLAEMASIDFDLIVAIPASAMQFELSQEQLQQCIRSIRTASADKAVRIADATGDFQKTAARIDSEFNAAEIMEFMNVLNSPCMKKLLDVQDREDIARRFSELGKQAGCRVLYRDFPESVENSRSIQAKCAETGVADSAE